MANDFEKRLGKVETRLDQHLVVIHEFIDELRADREVSQKRILQNEIAFGEFRIRMDARMSQNEDQIRRLVDSQASLIGTMVKLSESQDRLSETQGDTIKILRRMESKLDNHEGRLSTAGL